MKRKKNGNPNLRGMSLTQRFHLQYEPELNCGCWLWTGAISGRYGSLTAFGGKSVRAHRVSWVLHCGAIPDGLSVLHKCDTPLCVNPAHLFLGTQQVNVADMVAKGRANKAVGERHWKAKLTWEQVRDIRLRVARGDRKPAVALDYEVSFSLVAQICSGVIWKNDPASRLGEKVA